MYCKKCGGKLESYASNCAFCGTPVEKYNTNMEYVKQEKANKDGHMTALKWLGLDLLNVIPVVGTLIYLILMFKWASPSNKDLTLQGFAKSRLFLLLIAFILIAVCAVLILVNPNLLNDLKATLDEVL